MLSKKVDLIESLLLKEFLQIPYLHHGRTLSGADCWGAVILWYRMRLGIELWDINEDYPEDWKFRGKHYFIENYHKEWDKVDAPGEYDVILFKVGEEVNHAGIFMRNGKFLHIGRAGCSVGQIDLPAWRDRVEGFYRLKARR